MPSSEELGAIRAMAQDLPALWSAETTTQEERQTIVRLLVERIVVEVIDTSEQVRIECHWQGGVRTEHRVTRPVKNAKALSTYDALVARASELRCAGHDSVAIADILNREGWRPAKRCDAFSGSMVRHLLYTANPEVAARRLRIPKVEREPDEWTIPELSVRLGVPRVDPLWLGPQGASAQPSVCSMHQPAEACARRRRDPCRPGSRPRDAALMPAAALAPRCPPPDNLESRHVWTFSMPQWFRTASPNALAPRAI